MVIYKFYIRTLICFIALFHFSSSKSNGQEAISLAGVWNFALDEENKGFAENWQNKKLTDKIILPGTTDEAGYGTKTKGSDFGILTRAYKYYGAAWYQQEIEIPKTWSNKIVYLELERVMWQSVVFLDGKEISTQDALSSAHWHRLGLLSPGKHNLSIRINNDMIYNIGDKGHVYTEYTQSIWNGVVGRIQLVAKDKIHMINPKIETKIEPRSLIVSDIIWNETTKRKTVSVDYKLYDKSNNSVFSKTENLVVEPGKQSMKFSFLLPENIKLWNDVEPNLYRLKIDLVEKNNTVDSKEYEVGFREISSSKSKILVNGKPVFLRGNLDCVHFPLTGYPSCKPEDWEKIFRIYKDYGLNHVRFHSWCPPEAAFIAADRLGIYIQAETVWIDWWMTNTPADRKDMITKGNPEGLGKNPSGDAFVKAELKRMLESYGNHASFALMCIGNELGNSDFEIMESWMKPFKETDSRRLYSVSSARKIMPMDQFMATHYIDKLGSTRGIRAGARTNWDFEDVYSKANIPIIAHEIGQWPVYPNWNEIKKYTGVLKARNLEEFKKQAHNNKIEEQNEDFTMASGALNQIMYKYEIESFLRTPSCAGIQLLSMQDYQGQGEALIGWLDVFYNSKGITTPETFRNHHDTTVMLLRMDKFVWQTNQVFTADIQLAHYGTSDISDEIYWKIKDEDHNLIQQGNLKQKTIPQGTSLVYGQIQADLSEIKKARMLTIELGLKNRPLKNTWNIWVYPSSNTKINSKVYLTNRFDDKCQQKLAEGGLVLLNASELGTENTADKISFYPLYWSLTFFPGQGKNTIGMVIKDKHPVFLHFPTEKHSDWQWESIYKGAKAFYINNYPESYKPMAQPVDDFHRNNKLASIFELKVGKGKLLVCGFNLNDSTNPVSNQLLTSILHYMESNEFNPEHEDTPDNLRKMFTYIEPLKSTIPGEFSKALLYVEAGGKLNTPSKSLWSNNFDKFESQRNTSYQIQCDTTINDGILSGWQGREISIQIQCPQGIIGSFYVYLQNKKNKGGQTDINFEGREYSLSEINEKGVWIQLHVMREDSNDGNLRFNAKVKNGTELIISKIALTEE